jgi:hypothetical protein
VHHSRSDWNGPGSYRPQPVHWESSPRYDDGAWDREMMLAYGEGRQFTTSADLEAAIGLRDGELAYLHGRAWSWNSNERLWYQVPLED